MSNQWTCDSGDTLRAKKNQIWRLQGMRWPAFLP
ncbi:hypothetical protein OHU10_02180 [Streptomyces europaeiscabiei]|nr:hypothetical protein [Streptomyces europaeiscabiei]